MTATERSKTGGGVGTNQYQIRGQAKARPSYEAYGYSASQVVRRGRCVWPRTGVDGPWCLKHRQLAPEVRELSGLQPCVASLKLDEQCDVISLGQAGPLGPWVHQLSIDARMRLAGRMTLSQLDWAKSDPDVHVRQLAAERWPVGQLDWATTDPHYMVRWTAAMRMPTDQLGWVASDPEDQVRRIAAERMAPDQLGWASRDTSANIRLIAARRMPPDQLGWAAQDPDAGVRKTAAERMAHAAQPNEHHE